MLVCTYMLENLEILVLITGFITHEGDINCGKIAILVQQSCHHNEYAIYEEYISHGHTVIHISFLHSLGKC